MKAEKTNVSNLYSVELCDGCPFAVGHNDKPMHGYYEGWKTSGEYTTLQLASDDHVSPMLFRGIRTGDQIINAIDSCKQPIDAKEVICGAVASLDRKK
jgi:hypothetical protein